MISLQIAEILEDQEYELLIKLLAGKSGLLKKVNIPRIQRPGLALTGDTSHLQAGRVQILGKSEMIYLKQLDPLHLRSVLTKICQINLSAIVVTRGTTPPKVLVDLCEQNSIPLFSTDLITSHFVNRLTKFLEDKLTASTSLHGVLLEIFGVGVLIIGKSGIGKSEAALDLIIRGHRLVADDMVEVKKKPPRTLEGQGPQLTRHHMEIRGLGIINAQILFGVASTRDKKTINLVLELFEWDSSQEYDRLGLQGETYSILEVALPFIRIPVRPGRNITTIIEVAARNHLLKQRGYHSAQVLEERVLKNLSQNSR